MEVIILIFLILSLIAVFAVDTVKKRRNFLDDDKQKLLSSKTYEADERPSATQI